MMLETSALDILDESLKCERERSAIYITQASYRLLSEYFVLFRQLSDTTVSPPARLRILVRKDSAERKTATLFHFHPVSLSLFLITVWIMDFHIRAEFPLKAPAAVLLYSKWVACFSSPSSFSPFLSLVLSFPGHF